MKKILFLILLFLFLYGTTQPIEIVRQKNQGTFIAFMLVDADGDFVNGGTLTIKKSYWTDGGAPSAFAVYSTHAPAQVAGATGWYSLQLDATDLNTDYIAIQCSTTLTGTKPQALLIRTMTGDPLYASTNAAGRLLNVDANNNTYINLDSCTNTLADAQMDNDIKVDINTWVTQTIPTPAQTGVPKVDATYISGDGTSADNAELFFDGTGYAGTNNVIPTVTTVGTVTVVTGLTASNLDATISSRLAKSDSAEYMNVRSLWGQSTGVTPAQNLRYFFDGTGVTNNVDLTARSLLIQNDDAGVNSNHAVQLTESYSGGIALYVNGNATNGVGAQFDGATDVYLHGSASNTALKIEGGTTSGIGVQITGGGTGDAVYISGSRDIALDGDGQITGNISGSVGTANNVLNIASTETIAVVNNVLNIPSTDTLAFVTVVGTSNNVLNIASTETIAVVNNVLNIPSTDTVNAILTNNGLGSDSNFTDLQIIAQGIKTKTDQLAFSTNGILAVVNELDEDSTATAIDLNATTVLATATGFLDSATTSRIIKRNVWGIKAISTSGSDSTTIAQRTIYQSYVAAAASVDTASISRAVWGASSFPVTLANRTVSASCAGTGANTVTLYVKDGSDSTGIGDFNIDITDSAGGGSFVTGTTNTSGVATFYLDNSTWKIVLSATGWAADSVPAYLIVSGTTTNTYYANEISPGTPSSAAKCRIYTYVHDLEDNPVTNYTLNVSIPQQYGTVKYGTVLVNPPWVSMPANLSGCAYIDIYRSSELTSSTGQTVKMQIKTIDSQGLEIRKVTKEIPDSTSWNIVW